MSQNMRIEGVLFLISTVMRVMAVDNQQIRLLTQVFVCEGDKIPLMTRAENMDSKILNSKIFKAGDGIVNLMVKEGNNKAKLAPRVEYIDPMAIYLHDATVEDTGPYEIHIIFAEGSKTRSAWHRFHVTVFTGCPHKAVFYAPEISYKLDNGPLTHVPKTKTVTLEVPTMLTLNVTITKANLPATCTITGRGRTVTAEGAGDRGVHCLATFHNQEPDNYTVGVTLEHFNLHAPSATTIQVLVTDPDDESGDTSSKNIWLKTVLPLAICIVVGAVIVTVVVVMYRRYKRQNKGKSTFEPTTQEEVMSLNRANGGDGDGHRTFIPTTPEEESLNRVHDGAAFDPRKVTIAETKENSKNDNLVWPESEGFRGAQPVDDVSGINIHPGIGNLDRSSSTPY